MLYAICTILYIAAVIYAFLRYKKLTQERVSTLTIIIAVVFWGYFTFWYALLLWKWEPTTTVRTLGYMAFNTLMPLCYMYVCEKAHLRTLTPTTFVLFLLILLNLFGNATIYLDNMEVKNMVVHDGVNFYRHRKEVFSTYSFSVVEMLQGIWISVRTFILMRKMKKQPVKMAPKTKYSITIIAILLIAHIIEAFMPLSLWEENRAFAYIYFITHLILASTTIYLLGNGFFREFLLDENEEPVYTESTPKFDSFKQKMEKLMVDDRVFTNKDMSVEMMAQLLGTNRTYLAQMMKEHYGITFNLYVNRMRVEEAKRLMKTNKIAKLEDVASLCGFNSASTFTKTFKAIEGVTPRMWK